MIFIITLSVFSLAFFEDVITVIPDILESKSTAQTVILTCTENGILAGDEIAFSTDDTYDNNDQKIPITSGEVTSLTTITVSATFATKGPYTIFYTNKDDTTTHSAQTKQQIVITAISANSITGITPPGKIYPNKQVSITLTFADYSLRGGDKIILSITGNASSKKEITLEPTFDSKSMTHTAQITFPVDGTYNLSIKRGESEVEQTGKTVLVNPSTNNKNKIKSAKKLYKTPGSLAVSIEVDAVVNDNIGFSLTSTINPLWTLQVGKSGSKVEMAAKFTEAGIYNMFYQVAAESDTFLLQDVKQIVFGTAISGATITKVEGTAKAEADASIKITFVKQTLYDTDKIIFAIGDTIGTDKAEMVLAGVDFAKTEHSQTVKFPKEGTYNVWIQRDTDSAVKQTNTGVQIIVAAVDSKEDDGDSSNWLSMSFMILTGLLLL